jgi:hypothetical protein
MRAACPCVPSRPPLAARRRVRAPRVARILASPAPAYGPRVPNPGPPHPTCPRVRAPHAPPRGFARARPVTRTPRPAHARRGAGGCGSDGRRGRHARALGPGDGDPRASGPRASGGASDPPASDPPARVSGSAARVSCSGACASGCASVSGPEGACACGESLGCGASPSASASASASASRCDCDDDDAPPSCGAAGAPVAPQGRPASSGRLSSPTLLKPLHY